VPWGLREHFTPASFRINFYPYDLASEIHRNDRVRRLMQREFVNGQRFAGGDRITSPLFLRLASSVIYTFSLPAAIGRIRT